MDQQIKQELVRHLAEVLPDAGGQLEALLEADQRLRDICIEYEEIALCRRRLMMAMGRDQEKFDEYTDLLRDLEKELLSIFSEIRTP